MKHPNTLPIFSNDLTNAERVDPRFRLTRSGTTEFTNKQGALSVASIDQPALEYGDTGECNGLKINSANINLFLNSEAAVNQSITVVAGFYYSVSWQGSGEIAVSPIAAVSYRDVMPDGRQILIFKPTSTTISVTVTGQVTKVCLTRQPWGTDYIATKDSQVQVSNDRLYLNIEEITDSDVLTIFTEVNIRSSVRGMNNRPIIQLRQNTASSNYVQLYLDRSSANGATVQTAFIYGTQTNTVTGQGSSGAFISNGIPLEKPMMSETIVRGAISIDMKNRRLRAGVNGVVFGSLISNYEIGDFRDYKTIYFGSYGDSTNSLDGYIRKVSIFNEALSDSDISFLTKA